MGQIDGKQERNSFPSNQKTGLREATITEQRSSLSATHRESKRKSITEDDVRRRAYELYLQRGGAPGNDLADWLQAERELRAN